jgi:hypothetical protein
VDRSTGTVDEREQRPVRFLSRAEHLDAVAGPRRRCAQGAEHTGDAALRVGRIAGRGRLVQLQLLRGLASELAAAEDQVKRNTNVRNEHDGEQPCHRALRRTPFDQHVGDEHGAHCKSDDGEQVRDDEVDDPRGGHAASLRLAGERVHQRRRCPADPWRVWARQQLSLA